jgi:hypothetical protein
MNHRVLIFAALSLICAGTLAYGLIKDEMPWPRGSLARAEHEDDHPTTFWFLGLFWFSLAVLLALGAIQSWGRLD